MCRCFESGVNLEDERIALAAFDKHFVAKRARKEANGWKNSREDDGGAKNEKKEQKGEKAKSEKTCLPRDKVMMSCELITRNT